MQADGKPTTTAVVLAAGLGTRMKSDLPKVLHPVAGRPMLGHVLGTLDEIGADHTVVVIGEGMANVEAAAQPHATAVQKDRLGTGHAVLAAREFLAAHPSDDLMVLYGDTPLITAETLSAMLAARRAPAAAPKSR